MQHVDLVTGTTPAGSYVENAVASDLVETGDGDIGSDRLLADQAITAVLRHQPKSECHGIVWAGN